MKKSQLLLIGVLFFNQLSAQLIDPLTPSTAFPAYKKDASGLTLTFSDEFDATGAPSTSRWTYQDGNRKNNATGPDGWWSKDDVYMENKNLVIRVKSIPNKNPILLTPNIDTKLDSDAYDYSCGAILSKGKFSQLYGKYEIRCQLPTKQGWWVAFWMMQGTVPNIDNSGVDGSEVDIFEGFGWTNKINQAIHWDGYGVDHKSISKQTYDTKLRTGFHTYTMEWSPTAYVFYIDGVKTWTSIGGGICTTAGHLLITGEISTDPSLSSKGWANTPDPSLYPDYFLVDYVRVWKETIPSSLPSALESIIDTDVTNLQILIKGNEVKINADTSFSLLQICDITGKSISQTSLNENTFSLQLKQGIYIVIAKFVDGTIVRKKIQV